LEEVDKVRAFHAKFGFAVADRPAIPDPAVLEGRRRLIEEELGEWVAACRDGNLPAAAREMADLLYSVLGAAVNMGLDPARLIAAVHVSNMAKVPNPDGGKPLKPEGWQPPDESVLLGEE
jgi:predicted HAD superfamily Cof-like phosphohydrolase